MPITPNGCARPIRCFWDVRHTMGSGVSGCPWPDAYEQIAELKRQTGKDILVFGSRTLWNDLLANNLVDELHLMIGPVVLGAGTSVFDGQPAVSLRLIDTRTWDGSGNVLVRYEVRGQET